jgi:hypothetical protein
MIKSFVNGSYKFSANNHYVSNTFLVPQDQLAMYWIYQIIKPSFDYIMPKSCKHLEDPNDIDKIVEEIKVKHY